MPPPPWPARFRHANAIAGTDWISVLILLLAAFVLVLVVANRRQQRRLAGVEQRYAEVTHAARLALLAEITASVSHEVTQPLSASLSNVETAELLLRHPEPDLAQIREILTDIRKDDLRANNVVRQLRSLMRKRDVRFESVDVNALVSNVLDLIHPDAARRNMAVSAVLDPALGRATSRHS